MNISLIKRQSWQNLTIHKKLPVLLLSLVVFFPNRSSLANTIELDNNNFNQYLNADHPVKGRYRLISDIDLSRFLWKPVGNASVPFSLTLDGDGHVISGLEVSTSADNTASGLFGSLHNSTIRQILLKQPKVTSSGNTSPAGALVGELRGSRVEEVVNYAGTIRTGGIRTGGFHSHGGGLAGSVSDSTIRNCVNTGAVTTTRSASAGGIAGLADQSSSVSNDLNTGKIISRYPLSSPAGGVVGTLKSNSIANNNMNTGEVSVSHTEHSGGIAGEAETAEVSYNLNTGKIASDYLIGFRYQYSEGGSSGGIVGKSFRHTQIKQNLNTGSIASKYSSAHAGGIAGQASNTDIVQNVNVGTVTTDGSMAFSGGIAGDTSDSSSIHDNLNAGAIKENGARGAVGGISGSAFHSASVYDNVNTGSVQPDRLASYESAAAARLFHEGRIDNNLDTFTRRKSYPNPAWRGYNKGVKRLSKTKLKSGLNGLSSELWNAGDATQLPMLKGVNTPYRDLARINGSRQANNQFPTVLNEFADPGGAANATSFNRTVWNGQDGYLPFPNAFFEAQTLLAGVDCTQGGFDCSGVKDIMTTLSSTVQTSTDELTTDSVARTSPASESPSEASSTVPSSAAQSTTVELTTTSVARASPASESPSEEASSTVPPSTAQPTTGELTTASVAQTSPTSESPSEKASSTVPPSTAQTAQPTTGELTTASVTLTSPTPESPSEVSSAVPSSSAQPTTSELTTTSATLTSPIPESPSETLLRDKGLSSYTDLADNTSSTTYSPSLSGNCPLPEGTPLFQTYDQENQRIYVVIQPESSSKGILLARYKGTELDKQFGLCGVVKYTTTVDHAIILDSLQSLTGQVIHETAGSHLDIVATTTSGKVSLLEFPLSTERYRARFTVRNNVFPENVQISDTAYHQGVMYLTGTIDNSLFVGRYRQGRLYFREKYPEDKEQGLHLKLSPDGKHLFVSGKSDEDASYSLFLRQYYSEQLKPAASFGNNGKMIMTTSDIDTLNSHQDILMQKDQSYVAVFSPEEEKLAIRRFATDNGQMDSAFIINDRIDFSSRTKGSATTVRLITKDDFLHAIIYNSDGHVNVVTYQNQINVHRFDTTFAPAVANSMRPVFVGNNAYLAVENADLEEGSRLVRMQEISLELENYNYQESPVALSSARSSEGMSGLEIGLIAVSSVTVATIAVIVAIKKFKRRLFRSGMETHELLTLGYGE
ncbi:hypothetical protein [Endozoicomonas sp. 4G]|uniref:hypothetical protein n=1 Tax=Endozoicomonas sp. 4G TaxID=2872754 RepID=UPI0020789FC0|nr:hypothetical protein [Endozoicomonas sp. 4G]